MKFLILVIGILFLFGFQENSENYSNDNVLSRTNVDHYLVLQTINTNTLRQNPKLSFRSKFLETIEFKINIEIVTKIISHFEDFVFLNSNHKWGPLSLATPPPSLHS